MKTVPGPESTLRTTAFHAYNAALDDCSDELQIESDDSYQNKNLYRSDASLGIARVENSVGLSIYSLPDEIISDTFLLVCLHGQGHEGESEVGRPPIPFEVALCHVSALWRRIALTTQLLWSHIHIPSCSPHFTAACISRSGQCPLNVSISVTHDFDLLNSPELSAEFDLAFAQINRWRHCRITSACEVGGMPVIARLSNTQAPSLEHFSLCVTDVYQYRPPSSDDLLVPHLLTGGCPNLTFIRLRGLAMHFFRPSFTSVRTLHLDQTTSIPLHYSLLRRLLTSAPCLTNLSLYGDITGLPMDVDNSLELHALRSLRICGLSGLTYSGILLIISAPHLESLVLKDVNEQDLDPFWASPSESQFPQLRSLAIYDSDLSERTYDKLFSSFPAVVEFTSISSSYNPPEILKIMSNSTSSVDGRGGPNPVPWPELQTLGIVLDMGEVPLIKEAVRKRMSTGHSLVRLRLATDFALTFLEEYEWFQSHITMETLDIPDRWPKDSGYADMDDDLLL